MHKHGTPQHGMFSTQNGQGRASQMQLRVQTSVHGVVDSPHPRPGLATSGAWCQASETQPTLTPMDGLPSRAR